MKNFKLYSILISFLILAFLPKGAFAGDYASLNFIGFSNDGKYLAFEEYGWQDGSGFPYSNYFFVDVAKNVFAAPPVRKLIEKENVTENSIRSAAKKAAAANLKKFKIVQGNVGKLVVARLLTDLDAFKLAPGGEVKDQTVRFTDEISSNYFENEFELSLKTSEVKIKECEYNYEPVLKFELMLKNLRSDLASTLQNDKSLPASRNCPHTYSIQNVYLYQNKIAVFMNVYTMGFEGPDMRYMVVSGEYR